MDKQERIQKERRYLNAAGRPHRLDGPAVELPDGTRLWFKEGTFHRADGPAIEWPGGGKEWWVEGKMHRVGGPANERPNGRRWFYLDDIPVTEQEAMTGKREVRVCGGFSVVKRGLRR